MSRAENAHNLASSSGLDFSSSPDIIARMSYAKNAQGYVINENDGSLVIDVLSHRPIHKDNATEIFNQICDVDYLFNQLNDMLECVDDDEREILMDDFIKDNSISLSDRISEIIIQIILLFEFPKKIHNMFLSLVPDQCNILFKILPKFAYITYTEIEFLFNEYYFLLNNDILLIQNHFLLNNDITEEISKQLVKQVVKEDYRTMLLLSNHKITDDIIKLAIECSFRALCFIPNDKMTDDIIRFAVEKSSLALIFVPEDRLTDEIIILAIINNSHALQFVPDYKMSDEIIKIAVQNNGKVLQYVPKNKQTDEIIELAAQNNQNTIDY